jgi:poly-gamma-glutamate synthesis protein (capsule biosynthesis protein)
MWLRAVDDPAAVGIDLSVHPPDRTAVLSQIEEAAQQADWVVMTVHSHQGAGGARNVNTTPSFLIDFAHDAIDAGADVFVCTGPHVLRGIEVYDWKPIFYSLGTFILQSETQQYLPAESFTRTGVTDDTRPSKVMDNRDIPSDWWRSVVPICEFTQGGELDSVEILPITLGEDDPRSQRGIPTHASGETHDEIVHELEVLSSQFNTQLVADGDSVLVEPT